MTRTAVRGAFAVIGSVVLACALVLAAGALAAKPKKSAHFTGTTSADPVEGFKAPVKFTVAPTSKGLYNFTFGTFGCFGAGGFRPGVNPYTGHSLINAGKLEVPPSGKFSDKAISAYTVSGTTTTTTITVSGKFSTPKRVSGTISFSQVVSGSEYHSSCGPGKLSFSAATH
jgi:hypothetical protein